MTHIRGDISKIGEEVKVRQETATNLQATVTGGTTSFHQNGIVGVAPITITLPARSKSILLDNTHANNNLDISLDNGVTYKTLVPRDIFACDIEINSIMIRGSGAGTTYQFFAVLK